MWTWTVSYHRGIRKQHTEEGYNVTCQIQRQSFGDDSLHLVLAAVCMADKGIVGKDPSDDSVCSDKNPQDANEDAREDVMLISSSGHCRTKVREKTVHKSRTYRSNRV